jgi:chromosome segregation ATPase
MSEDRTKETKDARSFEEQVFARFDSVDERFDRVEGRLSTVEIKITNLEAQRYDTKPIWERALAEIAETNRKIDLLQLAIDGLRKETNDSISGLRIEMNSEFAAVRQEMKHAFHGVGYKIDALNHNILQVQADQIEVEGRLQDLESQVESP